MQNCFRRLNRHSRVWLMMACLGFLLLFAQHALSGETPATLTPPGTFGPARALALLLPGESRALSARRIAPSLSPNANANASSIIVSLWKSYPLYAGEITSIASVVTPTITQTVYAGTRDAGVFKTTDGGQSWKPARSGLTFYPIRSLEVDPQHPDILYAGTDYDGVWKSTDGGATWLQASSGLESLIVFNIVVDPQNSDILYAGLAGGIGLCVGNIYKSYNGGATWVLRDDGIPRYSGESTHTNGIISLAMDPDNPLLLYAGTNYYGAFRSANGGETWTALNDGLPFQPGSTDSYETVNALATDPHHANRLSAIIGGEYYVFDGAWQKVDQGTYDANSGLFTDYLYFHPVSSTVIYSAGDRFSKSEDGGVNWAWLLGWNVSSQVPDVAFHPSFPDTLYAATDILFQFDGGVYQSLDQGETWAETSQGITAAVIRSVAIDPQDAHRIYAGAGEGHFYRTQDGGETWQHGYTGGSDVSDVAVDPLNSQNLYIADGLKLVRSLDYGETFERIDAVEDAQCIATAVQTSTVVYVGTGFQKGIYKSPDGGTTWAQKNQGLPLVSGDPCPILSLAVDPNDPETVWAGTQYGGGIVKSSDGGEHWQTVGLTETNLVEAIAVNPTNSNEILAGGGFLDGRIYKSTDGGVTWQVKVSDIAFVQEIVYDPRNPRWVYAATEGYGVLRSFNGGESWLTYNDGIFYPMLYSLAITADDPPLLIAGSYSSGLYWIHPSAPIEVYLPLVLKQ